MKMKKVTKKKKIIKVITLCMVAVATIGVVSFKNISSKAGVLYDKGVMNNEDYDEIVQKYRKSGVNITITTLDDLYTEFDKLENVDEDARENLLAKASDEVLMKFLLSEVSNVMRIDEKLPQECSTLQSTNEIYLEGESGYIKDTDVEYYKKGKDSYKKVITITNKYGLKFESISIDESEEDNDTRGLNKFTKIGKPQAETITKSYGDRRFSRILNSVLCKAKSIFGYTISQGKLKARYITGEVTNYVSPLLKFAKVDNVITDSSASGKGENIDGHVVFQCTEIPALYGGWDMFQYKANMCVTMLGDNPKSKSMRVEESAQGELKI